jgi:hypothetical protein
MCAAPLTYIIRPTKVPTAEDLAVPAVAINNALVLTFSFASGYSTLDNRTVFEKVRLLLTGSPLLCHIQPSVRSRNGRQAVFALRRQAEGPTKLNRRITAAYAKCTTKYTSWSRRFTFDDYIICYQTAFNELESLNECLSKTKKVTDFLSNEN